MNPLSIKDGSRNKYLYNHGNKKNMYRDYKVFVQLSALGKSKKGIHGEALPKKKQVEG